MITPKLDSRTVEDILAEIKRKSKLYTPEWRFDLSNPDGGVALVRLFAEMFFGTIDRYNRYPDKCYIEFLNMLGVCAKSVSPAVGMARADLVDGAPQSVFIKKGTRLFTDISREDQDDIRVVFETTSGFYAIPSNLTTIFMTDNKRDIITRTDINESTAFPISLFMPAEEQNLERHCFALAHSAVLRLCGPSEIRVKLSNHARSFENEALLSRLCDPSFANWSYLSENGRVRLSAKYGLDHIALSIENRNPILFSDCRGNTEGEELLPWIFCEMKGGPEAEDITVDEAALSSACADDDMHHGITPDGLFFNDTELNANAPGYCFGREPNAYDSLYIACDEALGKHGAVVTAEFLLKTVVYQDNSLSENALEFHQKLLVDKNETKAAPFDNIFISEIIWEYWNGLGWARLEVSGDINPFSCDMQVARKHIRFVCPNDIDLSMQNAREAYWIRARIRSVENRFSLRGRWLLPLLRSVLLRFDYGTDFLPAQQVFTSNSLTERQYSTGASGTPMTLFSRMEQQHHAVYFMFDKPPEGYPINLYFDFLGSTDGERILTFEHLTGDAGGRTGWSELKVNDRTSNFSRSGIVSLFCPKDFVQAELFGERGYWIRVVNRSMDFGKNSPMPKLSAIVKNTVDIIQRQTVNDEHHQVYAGTPDQSFTLGGVPIISCELWIDEINETQVSELNRLKAENESAVRMVYSSDGVLEEAWVLWEAKESLAAAGRNDRVYQLDCSSGRVTFGNGINGRIPAYTATAEVSCSYSYGGGTSGNLPAETIDGLIVGIPYVEQMTNHRPTCGGSDGQSMETVRKIGTARLLHRGRAVTARDFESLVLEEFTEVREVCCFADRNALGHNEDGCVTVVVMPYDYADSVYSLTLCKKIYDFISQRAAIGLCAGNKLSVIPAGVMRVSTEITVSIDDYEFAAEVEQNAEQTISALLDGSGSGGRIGVLPRSTDIISALRQVDHVSHVSSVLLMGEYYRDGEKITVSLDDISDFRYFISASGNHLIKI